MEQLRSRIMVVLIATFFKSLPFIFDWGVIATMGIIVFSLVLIAWAVFYPERKVAIA